MCGESQFRGIHLSKPYRKVLNEPFLVVEIITYYWEPKSNVRMVSKVFGKSSVVDAAIVNALAGRSKSINV